MNNLAECGDFIDLFSLVAVEFGDQHAEDGTPSFSASVKQVPDGLGETLSETAEVALLFSVEEVGGEGLEVLFGFELPGDDFLQTL